MERGLLQPVAARATGGLADSDDLYRFRDEFVRTSAEPSRLFRLGKLPMLGSSASATVLGQGADSKPATPAATASASDLSVTATPSRSLSPVAGNNTPDTITAHRPTFPPGTRRLLLGVGSERHSQGTRRCVRQMGATKGNRCGRHH